MNWGKLLSTKRFGLEEYHDDKKRDRTEYQRDYDRLIFSAPFRRLQNKTQVFPLPGSVFVHNRLTHSLEVSSVGRSIGSIVGRELRKKYPDYDADFEEIDAIVAAACLAHDLGNPPFGHSGEKAIGTYFSEGNGTVLEAKIREEGGRWDDFVHFEGNANSIRLLIHQFEGRRKGGFVMTYSMLASIVKYPYSSENAGKKGKFGFFMSEEPDFLKIAGELGLKRQESEYVKFSRHPLVYLVEAADDICYQVMDIEDAYKLNIISKEKTFELLLRFFSEERQASILRNMEIVRDQNEQIAYLRSSVIGALVGECSRVFLESEEELLNGSFQGALIDRVSDRVRNAYKECSAFSIKHIYKSKEVLDIELAGYKIIGFLLDTYMSAVKEPGQAYSKLLLDRLPEQYEVGDELLYNRIMAILDFISGMTDVYALDLYRKITGMSLPAV